jgi:hypothetical protein
MAIVEPMPRQMGAKGGPRWRGHEQHKGGGHHVMGKAGQGDVFGAQAPAKDCLTL